MRNLRCVLAFMFAIALLGSILLVLARHFGIDSGYVELIVFICQLGFASSFVTINVAVLILVSMRHRLKVIVLLSTINIASFLGHLILVDSDKQFDVPVWVLTVSSSVGILLSILISYKNA